jgi:hypothetical protein
VLIGLYDSWNNEFFGKSLDILRDLLLAQCCIRYSIFSISFFNIESKTYNFDMYLKWFAMPKWVPKNNDFCSSAPCVETGVGRRRKSGPGPRCNIIKWLQNF